MLVGADDSGLDLVVDLIGERLELIEPALDVRDEFVMVGERDRPGSPREPNVGGSNRRRDRRDVGPRRRAWRRAHR